jgi:hypothetical protein
MENRTLSAHRMGPTVWDDDGPTPMENRSKVDMTACSALAGSSDPPGSS